MNLQLVYLLFKDGIEKLSNLTEIRIEPVKLFLTLDTASHTRFVCRGVHEGFLDLS